MCRYSICSLLRFHRNALISRERYYPDPVLLSIRDIRMYEIKERARSFDAKGCASLLHLAAALSPYVFLASLHSVCSVTFSFPDAPSSRPRVFTYVPIQMAKVNFAITKYLARKSLRAMEPPTILALPPPSTGEKLPLDFDGEKGTPTPGARTHSRPRRAPEGNLFCQPNSRLLLTFAKRMRKYARAMLKNDQKIKQNWLFMRTSFMRDRLQILD